MVNFWQLRSGTELVILEERKTIGYVLPLNSDYFPLDKNNMNLSIVSGQIPRGLRLDGATLQGTPFEVQLDTRYTFVVRAEQYGIIDDRTFSIIVVGPDEPSWITPPDLLKVGANNNVYYILDNEIIDFQLEATDPDLAAGQQLEFFLAEGDGVLPPGIKLTTDGRLVGVVEPILAIEKAAASGNFDSNNYGMYPYDFGILPDNGFDSFFYDTVIYDTFVPSVTPKKLNRYYEFRVTVTDGDNFVKRKFRIYLVGDDFLRADNTIMKVANGVFTADNTYVRTPIWLTPRNLGVKRANNYLTIYLDTLDTGTIAGVITYELLPFNDDNTPSILPPGTTLDTYIGEITGRVPYQPAITIEYKFSVRATRYVALTNETTFKDKTFVVKLLGEIESVLNFTTDSNLGTISSNYISTLEITATSTVPNSNLLFTLIEGNLPPGLYLSYTGSIIGKINSFGTANNPGLTVFDSGNLILDGNTTFIDREFKFTVKVQDHFGFSAITKEFVLKVTDPKDKFYSNIYVQPFLKEEARLRLEELFSSTDIFNEKYIYRPNDPAFGLQKNLRMLVYAGIESKGAQYFISAMAKNHKKKKFILGNVSVAVAKNPGTNTTVYELIYINVIDPAENNKGITKNKIKIRSKEKRTVDSVLYNQELDTIENTDPYGINLYTRRFGQVSYYFYPNFELETRDQNIRIESQPIRIGTRNIFEIDFTDKIIGSNEPFRFRPIPENTLKIDSNAITIDEKNKQTKYISNISNMRNNIRAIGETDIDFLPLWMRTVQPGQINFLGYIKAIPLCYCKPEGSKEILTALRTNNTKFNEFNYDIDRYIIDSVEGNSTEQYLLFHNYDYNV